MGIEYRNIDINLYLNKKNEIKNLHYLNNIYHAQLELGSLDESILESFKNISESKIDNMINYFHEDKIMLVGAFDNDDMIGLLWGFPQLYDLEKRFVINMLYIKEKYRGKQIGHFLLEWIKNYAGKAGFDGIMVRTTFWNVGAQKFYTNSKFNIEEIGYYINRNDFFKVERKEDES